jgi:hypothetical protein
MMWYVVALIWLVLVIGIFWAYRQKRRKHAMAHAKQLDALLIEAKRSIAGDDTAGIARQAAVPSVVPLAPEFTRKPRLLSPSELSLYHVFRSALPDYEVFAKWPLSELVDIAPATSVYEREQKLRRLAQHKVDLVICNSELEVVVAVVTGESTVTGMAQAENARFMEDCLKLAGIRLVRINSKAPPLQHQVRNLVYAVAGQMSGREGKVG